MPPVSFSFYSLNFFILPASQMINRDADTIMIAYPARGLLSPVLGPLIPVVVSASGDEAGTLSG